MRPRPDALSVLRQMLRLGFPPVEGSASWSDAHEQRGRQMPRGDADQGTSSPSAKEYSSGSVAGSN